MIWLTIQVQAAPDNLGHGESERNPSPTEDWRKPKLLPGQSKGYLRGGPQDDNIVPFARNSEAQPSELETPIKDVGVTSKHTSFETPVTLSAAGKTSSDNSSASKARFKGYTGDACPDCGHFTLIRNGTCQKCDTCGTTTGCS